jgi:hypothetical protein
MNQDRSSETECPSFKFGIVSKDMADLLFHSNTILLVQSLSLHILILEVNRKKLQLVLKNDPCLL